MAFTVTSLCSLCFDFQNAPCCPIAVVACYSGSSQDDHNVSECFVDFLSSHFSQLVVTTIHDFLNKAKRDSVLTTAPTIPLPPAPYPEPISAHTGLEPEDRHSSSSAELQQRVGSSFEGA